MATLSVVVSAYNEEAKIAECLELVKWADEIVFVDNESTDKTAAIVKKYTSAIFTRPNNLMLNVNKNFGFTKATSDWILSLDADERVTPELREEIESGIMNQEPFDSAQGKSGINGFWIPRKNIIFGKWMQHTGWYPDHQMRLFRRGKGKFAEAHVHEMIEVGGQTAYFKEHLLHYNYDSVGQFFYKATAIYAPNEAEQLLKKGYTFSSMDALRFPFREFLNRFFAQEGYKDGFHGLMLSLLMAMYHFIVFAKLWEKEGFKDGNENVLREVEQELRQERKELSHWFSQEKMKKTKNPLQKIRHRIFQSIL